MLLQEGDATTNMYEKDALLCTEDGNIFIWAGATVGGGSRINWCATPAHFSSSAICICSCHAIPCHVSLNGPNV